MREKPYVWWLGIVFGQERCPFFYRTAQDVKGSPEKVPKESLKAEVLLLRPCQRSERYWECSCVSFVWFSQQNPKFGSFGFRNHRALRLVSHSNSPRILLIHIDWTLVVFGWHWGKNRWKGDEYLWCLGKFRSHQVINPHFCDLRNWSSWYHGPCNSYWWHLGRGCSGRPGKWGNLYRWPTFISWFWGIVVTFLMIICFLKVIHGSFLSCTFWVHIHTWVGGPDRVTDAFLAMRFIFTLERANFWWLICFATAPGCQSKISGYVFDDFFNNFLCRLEIWLEPPMWAEVISHYFTTSCWDKIL